MSQKRIKLGEIFEIKTVRGDANFDRACDSAIEHAVKNVFEIDEDEYTDIVSGWDSNCSVKLEFRSYRVSGIAGSFSHVYSFATWVSRDG